MLRRFLLALVVVGALVAAALIRPPRAAPVLRTLALNASEPLVEASGAKSRGGKSHPRHHKEHHVAREHRSRRGKARLPIAPIDLNRADAEALARIPGISVPLASRIIAFRQLNGPFETLDELADVEGLSTRRVDSLSRYLVLR